MMKRTLQDFIISYLVRNQAPKRITYSSNRETRVFGFWVYLGGRGEKYVILRRLGRLKYECIKVDAPEDEADQKFIKYVTVEDGYSFSEDISVNLYHNSLQISDLPPLRAYLYGITNLYRFVGWRENLRFRKAAKKNEKAYALYKDRLRLLELIIDIRNRQHEESTLFPDKISHDVLMQSIARASVVTSQGYYTYVEPILKGLDEDDAIEYDIDQGVELRPKAWRIASDYYVEERRHKDNQRSLKWQRFLTAVLALAGIGNIFREEVRAMFGL